MEPQKITPALAREILSKNENNRPIRAATVDRYANMMKKGKWMFNGDTIAIDSNGNLINGQHRLNAVIQANKTIPGIIVKGLDPNAFKTIDVGRARTPGDALSVAFGAKSANEAAAICAYLIQYERSVSEGMIFSRNTRKYQLDHADICDMYKKRMSKINRVILQAQKLNVVTKFIPRTQYGALKILMQDVDNDAGKQFWSKMETGANVGARNPINVLRNHLIEGMRMNMGRKMDRDVTFNLIVKAWNLWRAGEQVDKIEVNDKEDTCELK